MITKIAPGFHAVDGTDLFLAKQPHARKRERWAVIILQTPSDEHLPDEWRRRYVIFADRTRGGCLYKLSTLKVGFGC